jgi:hypothetical protein
MPTIGLEAIFFAVALSGFDRARLVGRRAVDFRRTALLFWSMRLGIMILQLRCV